MTEMAQDSLSGAAVGAVIAALGYCGKTSVDAWRDWRRGQAERRNRLLRLASLLDASKVAYSIQTKHRDDLAASLKNHLTAKVPGVQGYEALFSGLFQEFTDQEAELHSIIRGITRYALRPINLVTSTWLEADVDFRTDRSAQGPRQQLAQKLNLLAGHLVLWHAKYEIWIPDRPEHALVYLADEQKHGLGFPEDLERTVHSVLASC
jgi:hypothetical protein